MTKLQQSLEQKDPISNVINATFTDGAGRGHTAKLYKLEESIELKDIDD